MAGRITIAEVESSSSPARSARGRAPARGLRQPGGRRRPEGKGIENRTTRPRTDRSAAPAAAGDEATEGDAR
jgi:3-oxoacid CoA-transferase subunit A